MSAFLIEYDVSLWIVIYGLYYVGCSLCSHFIESFCDGGEFLVLFIVGYEMIVWFSSSFC